MLEVLFPQVIAAQARNEDIVSVESVCERVLPEWPILSHGGQQDFIGRVAELLRGLASGDMRGEFRYESLREPHTRGRLVIESTPATRDPRGRTRTWQAQQRRAESAFRRPGTREIRGQLRLDRLADEGGLADD